MCKIKFSTNFQVNVRINLITSNLSLKTQILKYHAETADLHDTKIGLDDIAWLFSKKLIWIWLGNWFLKTINKKLFFFKYYVKICI